MFLSPLDLGATAMKDESIASLGVPCSTPESVGTQYFPSDLLNLNDEEMAKLNDPQIETLQYMDTLYQNVPDSAMCGSFVSETFESLIQDLEKLSKSDGEQLKESATVIPDAKLFMPNENIDRVYPTHIFTENLVFHGYHSECKTGPIDHSPCRLNDVCLSRAIEGSSTTTSSTCPLCSLHRVASPVKSGADEELEKEVSQAVEKILKDLDSSSSFSVLPRRGENSSQLLQVKLLDPVKNIVCDEYPMPPSNSQNRREELSCVKYISGIHQAVNGDSKKKLSLEDNLKSCDTCPSLPESERNSQKLLSDIHPVNTCQDSDNKPPGNVNKNLKQQNFICEICGKSFVTARGLRSHHTKSHGAEKMKHVNVACNIKKQRSYECGVCRRQFRVASVYSRHVSTHKTKTRLSNLKAKIKIKLHAVHFQKMSGKKRRPYFTSGSLKADFIPGSRDSSLLNSENNIKRQHPVSSKHNLSVNRIKFLESFNNNAFDLASSDCIGVSIGGSLSCSDCLEIFDSLTDLVQHKHLNPASFQCALCTKPYSVENDVIVVSCSCTV